jgi:hypothetical protein
MKPSKNKSLFLHIKPSNPVLPLFLKNKRMGKEHNQTITVSPFLSDAYPANL